MNKIKTIIIDDEPDAVNFIRSIIEEYCPKLEVVDNARSAKEGVKKIIEKNPDLVFLTSRCRMAADSICSASFLKKHLK
jgi:two-component system LytT family response regulator